MSAVTLDPTALTGTQVVNPAAVPGSQPDDPIGLTGAALPGVPAAPGQARRTAAPQVSPAGQLVIVIARWVLVLAGFGLAIWNAGSVAELRVQLAGLLTLAVVNFALHMQLLRRRPLVDGVAYAASAGDLAVISAMVAAQGGYASHLYVFYAVALLAQSVAFPLTQSALLAGATAALYALMALATLPHNATDMDLLAVLCRCLMLLAVAACGQVYRRIERDQARQRRPGDARLAAVQDVFFGQVVLIWARWAVILTGAITALWLSASAAALTLTILPVVVLMAVNFTLHARYVLERPANARLVTLLAAVDLAMVSAIVFLWDGYRGLASPFFVYYFPILLAFAFVFPPRLTATYTGAALVAYTAVCLVADPALVARVSDVKLLVVRLIALGAMGGLGTFYWRTQRALAAAHPGGDQRPGTLSPQAAQEHSHVWQAGAGTPAWAG